MQISVDFIPSELTDERLGVEPMTPGISVQNGYLYNKGLKNCQILVKRLKLLVLTRKSRSDNRDDADVYVTKINTNRGARATCE